MNWKFIIIATLFFLSIGYATAFTVGQTATQDQFNLFDFSTENFDVTFNNTIKTADGLEFTFDYIKLEKQPDGTWLTVADQFKKEWSKADWLNCREQKDYITCKNIVISETRKSVTFDIKSMRHYYDSQKTEDWDTINPNDFIITLN